MKNKYPRVILSTLTALLVYHTAAFGQAGFVRTVYFKTNSFSIDEKYKKTLDLVIEQVNSDTFGYLKVFGYADKKGSRKYNDILSKNRATAVYNYLHARVKIDTSRVYVTWLGESDSETYDLHFQHAKIQQRCVDIWVTYYKKE